MSRHKTEKTYLMSVNFNFRPPGKLSKDVQNKTCCMYLTLISGKKSPIDEWMISSFAWFRDIYHEIVTFSTLDHLSNSAKIVMNLGRSLVCDIMIG